MTTYLDQILLAHRRAAAADERPLRDLVERAAAAPPPRKFRDALAAEARLSVVAEVKRRSPSKGPLRPDLDPAALAAAYAEGGAACLSVLTDEEYFGGSAADLAAARAATTLPVLRKDFTVAPADIADARLMGADCVLLIVAALTADELIDCAGLARQLDLDVLVECHDERELDIALELGTGLVGVNQRDLATFAVDHERAARLAARIPAGVVSVAESGVRDGADAARLAEAGYDAILVGETLVTAADPIATIRLLKGEL